ncbi:hypothetical protein DFP72DRAFT_1083594 [Ephemerocybe angulata]|uniref:Uncharacterized protein n=1 Tax=Ephemerocybe angulata TaxID=980116 RepID=A0A8H6LUS4_9AGAR|nr:hypothetical protein DFP72DRAFT_1083590 [Tulosesus angulatus]KAF6741587.1 hypothetical protein DFP72DRAFT_1083594 [Tulosesus angulatus]
MEDAVGIDTYEKSMKVRFLVPEYEVFQGLLQAIFTAPNFPVQDKYQVLSVSRMVLNPILANRLLLNLRSNRDPGTQAAISTLLFDKPNPFSREESADYIGESRETEGPYVTGDEKEAKYEGVVREL